MRWTTFFVLAGIVTCGVFGQVRTALLATAQQSTDSGATTASRSRFSFDTFVITKTGFLILTGYTNEFLLIPQARFPGELRSILAVDLVDQIYVARFSEPGGIGVEGFYDICFQIKGGRIFTHTLELGGSLERVSDKIFVRAASYVYDRADKKVLRIKYGEPATPVPIAMTNVLTPFLMKE